MDVAFVVDVTFFVDVTFETFQHYEKAKSIMMIMAEEFKVLGTYKNAKQ